jgi:hypothetical protein
MWKGEVRGGACGRAIKSDSMKRENIQHPTSNIQCSALDAVVGSMGESPKTREVGPGNRFVRRNVLDDEGKSR